MKKVSILGTIWTIEERAYKDDPDLKECDGYCEQDIKLIVVQSDPDSSNVEKYKKQLLRHEIIHAFLFESGLGFNLNTVDNCHDEQMIDWFAIQYPKIKEVYRELDCE